MAMTEKKFQETVLKEFKSINKRLDSIDKRLDKVEARLDKLEKNQKTMINYFDKQDIMLEKRVTRIEKHLELPSLHQ